MRSVEEVIQNPDLLDELIEGLNAKPARERYANAKTLIALSERAPDILYPKFAFFTALLDHENRVFQWNAIRILANLARVDPENRFETIFDRYFRPVRGPVMITAGNVIHGGAVIAAARPELAARIADEILKVEKGRYATAECRNIATGHAIAAFGGFYGYIPNKEPVLKFVRKALKNTRPAVRKKAEKFLHEVSGMAAAAAAAPRRS